MAEEKTAAEKPPLGARLRRAGLFVLFVAVLLIPKMLALRRRRRWWNGLRVAAALAGGALVWAGPGVAGWLGAGALLLLALLVRPAQAEKTVDEQAHALGALVVVNGGRYQGAPARLFVASERVHVLNARHQPVLEIPLNGLLRAEAEEAKEAREAKEDWRLRLEWEGGEAVFLYRGFFAEHLARVAETTLRSRLRRELPVMN